MPVAKTTTAGPPKKPSKAQLAAAGQRAKQDRLVTVLRDARATVDYPLTLEALATRGGVTPEDAVKLLSQAPLKGDILFASAKSAHAPVAFVDDLERMAESEALFQFAAAEVRAKRASKDGKLRASVKNFVTDVGLPKAASKVIAPFEKVLQTRLTEGRLAEATDLLPPPASAIGEMLVRVIASQRHASDAAYPVPEKQVAGLADLGLALKDLKIAFKDRAFTQAVATCKPASFLLAADLERLVPRLVALAFANKLQPPTKAPKKPIPRTNLFNAKELATAALVERNLHSRLASAIEKAALQRSLPAGVCWLWSKGKPLFFRSVDLEPKGIAQDPIADSQGAPITHAEQEQQIMDAMRDLEPGVASGALVSITALRRTLSSRFTDKKSFDQALLRLSNRLKISLHRHDFPSSLSDVEREALVTDGHQHFSGVSWRS
jgi:hypothetical protein